MTRNGGSELHSRPVRRALLSLPVVSFAALACNAKITRAECTDMLDRYIDMTVEGEPGFTELPPAEARAAREMKKALRKGEPSYKRVQEQCEVEISRREYRCAMKAPTPETWQACID